MKSYEYYNSNSPLKDTFFRRYNSGELFYMSCIIKELFKEKHEEEKKDRIIYDMW